VQHALPDGLENDLHQQFVLLADEQRATIPGRPLRGEFRTQLVPDVAEGSFATILHFQDMSAYEVSGNYRSSDFAG
jgi:hypothetical protein